MPDHYSNQAFWQSRAKKLCRRINFAWFLQILAAPLLVTAILGAVGMLITRREFPMISTPAICLVLAGSIMIVALVCLKMAFSRFEKPDQTLVRIEAEAGLNNALSAATAGISKWPARPENLSESLRWHLPKTLIPPFAALALVALGLFIPISARAPLTPPPSRQPQAWSRMDSQLELLGEQAMVDEKYLEEMKERLEQLRAQEEEEWFSHASLEATDSLKESQASDMENL
ncbi:MAG: hypothetical protein H7Y36_07180, partial [Armatimonadetes bacterium]|nr:hypothetical protein [Akkermansiaceae bacterium]